MLSPSKLTPFDAIDQTMDDRYNTHLILLYFRLFGVSSTVYPSGIKLLCLGTFFNSRYFIWILLNDSKFINVCCWSFLSFTLFKVRIDAFLKKIWIDDVFPTWIGQTSNSMLRSLYVVAVLGFQLITNWCWLFTWKMLIVMAYEMVNLAYENLLSSDHAEVLLLISLRRSVLF